MAKQQAVTAPKKESKAVAVQNMDNDFLMQDAGAGADNVGAKDLAIPFLVILQSMSPQVDKKKPEYIKGAEAGWIINTVTQELFKDEAVLKLIPCYYEQKLIEWQPRETGGGLVNIYDIGDPIAQKATRDPATNRDLLPNGNILVTTSQHYVLHVREDGSYTPAVVSMSSTQLKHSKRWNSLMANIKLKGANGQTFTPATFSHVYNMKVQGETNNKGSWYGWQVETDGPVKDLGLYTAAKSFYQAVSSGKVKAAPPAAAHGDDGAPDAAKEKAF